jgi:Zn-finger nucleic acid-binding protein
MDFSGEDMEGTPPLICPLCEVHELDSYGRNSTLCPRCGRFGGVFLKTLREISALARRQRCPRLRVWTPGDAPTP